LRVTPVLAADGRRGQLVTVSARAQGQTLELACGQRRITLTSRPRVSREDGISKKPAYEWRRAGQVAIIRIRRFSGPPAELERLEQLVKDYPEHRRSPLIVVDMRGNAGGNDDYAYRWVAQAKRGPWQTVTGSVYPVGSFLPWKAWNDEVWAAISENRVDDPASVARRNELRQKWPPNTAGLSIAFKPDRYQGDAKVPYKGRIFVLVDRPCGSSGESAALAFQGGLGAKLVGERTAGLMEYGNVRTLVLPRTHLVFQFATKRNYFLTPMEGLGTPVDVYLAPELITRPVEELIPLLKTLPR
jgi:C-terminal processing protease CtpA/Prc